MVLLTVHNHERHAGCLSYQCAQFLSDEVLFFHRDFVDVQIGIAESPVIQPSLAEFTPHARGDREQKEFLVLFARSLNVDDLVILRPIFNESTHSADMQEALLMAFRQVGKKYDFNFDVNTTDKIVCSELAYISFPAFDWPTDEVLGRHSISPDNVAEMAWNNVPLSLIMFYHDGKLVPQEDQDEKMHELMLN